MSEITHLGKKWWAKGLLFENCNCQVVCPGHVSFKQLCTHERCLGHWSIHIEEGNSTTSPSTISMSSSFTTVPSKCFQAVGLNCFILTNGQVRPNAKL